MISFLKKLKLFKNFTRPLSYDIFCQGGFFRYTLYIVGVRSPQNVNYIYNLRPDDPKAQLHILFDLPQTCGRRFTPPNNYIGQTLYYPN